MNRRRMMLGGKKPLWIYKSGDSEFQNCTYHLTDGDYLHFPPDYLGKVEQITDCAVYRYVQNDNSPSGLSWLSLYAAKTFKGFSKLCFEAKVFKRMGAGSSADGIEIPGESKIRQDLSEAKALYEIELADFKNENEIRICLHTENRAYIYNMWLE